MIIDEIYIEPLEKKDNRGKKSIYGDSIKLLMLDILGQSKGKITISKTQLLKSLGITNENYSIGQSNIEKIANYLGIESDYVKDFYHTNNNNFSSIIKTALKDLESRMIIEYTSVKKVKCVGELSTRVATEFERVKVMEIEKTVMCILGFEKIEDLRKSKSWGVYKNLLNSLLKEHTDIEYQYTAYEILINNKFIDYEKDCLVDLILNKIGRLNTKKELNCLIISNSLNNARDRHLNFEKSKSKYKNLRKDESYLDNFKYLSDLLLKLDTPKIDTLLMSQELPTEIKNQIESLF